jgi:thiol:disulfide interchange protein
MNKILSLLSIAFILSAHSLEWSKEFNKTMKEAKQEHKPILMMYHASWCPECGYMKEVVFKDPQLKAYMKQHFKLLAFDITKDKNRLPAGFKFVGVPTFFFISPDGKLITKFEGSGEANEFLEKIKGIKQ